MQLLGFSNAGVLEEDRIEDYQSWMTEAQLFDTINNGWTDNLAAFFGRFNFNLKDQLILNASLRYEGSSKLGEEEQWGLFPAFGVALDFDEMLDISSFDQLKLRVGYGITGNVPQEGGLSQPRINRVLQDNGTFFDRVIWDANPNLRWEEKSELNMGIDFKLGKLEAYIDWYSRTVKDLIEIIHPDVFRMHSNENALQSNGLDINLGLSLYESQQVKYHTGLLLSFYQTKYKELRIDEQYALGVGGFVQNPPMGVKEGEPLGDIYGLIFETVDIVGNSVFEDVNGDGFVNTDIYGIFEEESDFQVVGNGLPTFELGWSNHLEVNGWHIQAFFRGAFGHSLVNRNRLYYETIPRTRNNYNLVDTELAEDGLRFGLFSSLHVEKANFLKLDNLTISRSIPFGKKAKQNLLNISLTGQNLFTITNYTGADPEPVLEDPGDTFGISLQVPIDSRNPFAPGIDRRNNYLPARTDVQFDTGRRQKSRFFSVNIPGNSKANIRPACIAIVAIAEPEFRDTRVAPAGTPNDTIGAACWTGRILHRIDLPGRRHRIIILHPLGNIAAAIENAQRIGCKRANGSSGCISILVTRQNGGHQASGRSIGKIAAITARRHAIVPRERRRRASALVTNRPDPFSLGRQSIAVWRWQYRLPLVEFFLVGKSQAFLHAQPVAIFDCRCPVDVDNRVQIAGQRYVYVATGIVVLPEASEFAIGDFSRTDEKGFRNRYRHDHFVGPAPLLAA